MLSDSEAQNVPIISKSLIGFEIIKTDVRNTSHK